jgi:hypothetical protein
MMPYRFVDGGSALLLAGTIAAFRLTSGSGAFSKGPGPSFSGHRYAVSCR